MGIIMCQKCFHAWYLNLFYIHNISKVRRLIGLSLFYRGGQWGSDVSTAQDTLLVTGRLRMEMEAV